MASHSELRQKYYNQTNQTLDFYFILIEREPQIEPVPSTVSAVRPAHTASWNTEQSRSREVNSEHQHTQAENRGGQDSVQLVTGSLQHQHRHPGSDLDSDRAE